MYRKIVRDVLNSTAGIEVVGCAVNGVVALNQIKALRPDVVTLDFEMPQLDGIGVLKKMASLPHAPAAIMISAFTTSGAKATTTALQEGAFDFILKPATKSLDESVRQLRRDLLPKLEACRSKTLLKQPSARISKPAQLRPAPPKRIAKPRPRPGLRGKPEMVWLRHFNRWTEGTDQIATPVASQVPVSDLVGSAHAANVYRKPCCRPGSAL